jgi:two-component sensor histidine kinase
MHLEDLYRLLRSDHVQAQGIVDTLEEPLLVLDQAGCVVTGNRGFFEKFRVARDDTVGRSLFTLGNGQWDIPELRRLLGEIIPRSAAIIAYEVNGDFPFIGRRTMLVSARRLIHPDNNSTSILILFEDVTDSRRGEAEKDILLAETRHRMKNLLAIVRALATQTAVEGRSGEEYRDAFLRRFEAVIRAEDLALAGSAEGDLTALIAQAVGSAGPARCRVDPGPPIRLKKSQLVPMSLILHELVANAWKYGAFSKPGGVAHLTWSVAPEGDRSVLRLTWREENGPPVTPPTHSGFGSRLIEYSAKQGLGGNAELKYEPTGLRVHVTAPMEGRSGESFYNAPHAPNSSRGG